MKTLLKSLKNQYFFNATDSYNDITINIDNWQGKAKLSQNKNDKEMACVKNHMGNSWRR